MNRLRTFVKSILWVQIAAVSGLLVAGALLTWVERDYRPHESFFTYRVPQLDYLPAWFAATLLLLSINGFWMFRLSTIEGAFHTPNGTGWGHWGATVPINPLRLFAINLVAIPATLGLFVVLRANCM